MSSQLSPAERYAAARTRSAASALNDFQAGLAFDLDPFQLAACAALEQGDSVLVAAPTGAGKTIVADFAVYLAMHDTAAKVFYTAPMKALSNQKYQDFVAEYGPDSVGLLTGDTNINSGARIVVMTTEVLRNMLYAGSDLLTDLSFVVMDEVHYLADRFRGAVWEEVIIHLQHEVRLVSLSATVSNAEEFGDWLQAVRGETAVIVSEERPVPLDQHALVRGKLLDLFDPTSDPGTADGAAQRRVNPELARLASGGGRRMAQERHHRHPGRYRERSGWDSGRLDRAQVVHLLEAKDLLPAIFFIFSRSGCDKAVASVLHAGVRLTNASERDEIRAIVNDRCRTLRDEDLAVLGYWPWLEGLERGVAAHHAGMLPAFKEVVEELFQRKLIRAVFATETLALGINMPARTVVLEKLEKFNGEARVPITPGEYTQLTGRAGRRGIDPLGHSVIQWQSSLNPEAVAALASRRTYPLNSSFRPTYNMAVNLIAQFGREHTRDVLESSFAQFQADRGVVSLARKVRSQQESLDGYAKSMTCHLGDFAEYARLRRELSDLERKGALRGESQSRGDRERRSAQLASLRKQLRQHPCHACSDRETHARWAERWWRLKRQTDELTRQIRERTGLIAKIFDRVTDVLLELGYLTQADGVMTVAQHGRTLRRIYGERDLLVAECLRRGTWRQLDPAALAAMATALVYEPRRDDSALSYQHLPGGAFRPAFEATTDLWSRLDELEREHRLPGSEPPSAALSLAMHRWAKGGSLDAVLSGSDLAAGDFVRIAKQTIDLLDQVSAVAGKSVGVTARQAVDAVRRGIVAYSSVD